MVEVAEIKIEFRPMHVADLAEVMRIEQENYAYPWTDGIFRDCVRAGYACVVCEIADHVVAYGVMTIAAGECHILNISVAPDWQGRGLGRELIVHMLIVATNSEAQLAVLEVRPSNVIAANLYYSLGFEQIGIRKGYYPAQDGREDARVLGCYLYAQDKPLFTGP